MANDWADSRVINDADDFGKVDFGRLEIVNDMGAEAGNANPQYYSASNSYIPAEVLARIPLPVAQPVEVVDQNTNQTAAVIMPIAAPVVEAQTTTASVAPTVVPAQITSATDELIAQTEFAKTNTYENAIPEAAIVSVPEATKVIVASDAVATVKAKGIDISLQHPFLQYGLIS